MLQCSTSAIPLQASFGFLSGLNILIQCDLCLEALGIDWHAIRDQGVKRGIVVSRVPIRDFDHGDQTLMLPEAVRTLAMLLALSNRVYVHCTAGINRATLTTLGYLTFVQVGKAYMNHVVRGFFMDL